MAAAAGGRPVRYAGRLHRIWLLSDSNMMYVVISHRTIIANFAVG